jgi:Flp pilus assembly protein TadD
MKDGMGGVGPGVKSSQALTFLAAFLVGAMAWGQTPDIPSRLPEPYLVLPFENPSPQPSQGWMRIAMPFVLGEKLESHPGLRPIYGELVVASGAAVPSDPAAVATAGKGARWVFSGTAKRVDVKLELTIRLWSLDKDVATLVAEEQKRGDFGETFEMMDAILFELLEQAKLTPARDAELKIRRAPTKDFYAFTLFGRGVEALHGAGGPANPAKAEKDLGRSVFIDPKLAEGHRMLAVLYAQKGKAATSRGQLSYALDLRPDYYAPLAALVSQAQKSKNREEAVELATRALTLRPWDLELRFHLGEMLWEDGDEQGAERELSRVVRVDPEHLAARRVLVLVHASKGNGEELARQLEVITRLDPGDQRAMLDLGAAYHETGRDEQAIAIYQALVDKNPRHLQAMKFLGDIYQARGDTDAAIAWYERALAANRNDPRPYFLLGAMYAAAGRDAKAMQIYKRAQRFPRYLGETYSNLGTLYYRMGDNNSALWYLKEAVLKKPGGGRIRYNYGLALAKAKARNEALTQFERAVELTPDEAEFRYALGVALLRLGRAEEAEKQLLEAMRLDPRHEDARHNLMLIEELRRRAKEGEIRIE